ncbi:MAG: LPS export ABC transporter periplasmic protein LptC [Candidatus Eremiobacteraeota bacterium]|nr:LPS export ABC transporter periplasmic protein LptC [Candidatus Eremiobacteraeota bacterium]
MRCGVHSSHGLLVRLLATLLCGLAVSCGRSGPVAQPSPAASTLARGPVYHISARGKNGHPVTISNIVAGAPEYTLQAASVLYATDLRKGRFQETTLYFYKGRKARLTVTAPTAVVDEVTHDVQLTGGVHATTAAGVTLSSDEMSYNENTRLLTAVGHVVAVEPGGNMLTGRRAIADLDLQQIRLFGESAGTSPASGTPLGSPSSSP